MCPSVWLAAPSSASGGAERLEPFSSAELPNSAVPQLGPVQLELWLLIKGPPRRASSPPGLWPLPRNCAAKLLPGARAGFEERRPEPAPGPLAWPPGRERPLPPLRNDLQSGVGAEQAQRAPGALALLAPGRWRRWGGDERLGPSLFAPVRGGGAPPDPAAPKRPGPSLPEHSRPRGSKPGVAAAAAGSPALIATPLTMSDSTPSPATPERPG